VCGGEELAYLQRPGIVEEPGDISTGGGVFLSVGKLHQDNTGMS